MCFGFIRSPEKTGEELGSKRKRTPAKAVIRILDDEDDNDDDFLDDFEIPSKTHFLGGHIVSS